MNYKKDEAGCSATLVFHSMTGLQPDPELQSLVEQACILCDYSCAAIHLLDGTSHCCVAASALKPGDADGLKTLCAQILQQATPLLIPDLQTSLQLPESDLRSYAGIALITSEGLPLGTLAVADPGTRQLTEPQIAYLQALARQATALLELRRLRQEPTDSGLNGTTAIRDAWQRLSLANQAAAVGVWEYDPHSNRLHWDAQIRQLAGLAAGQPELSIRAFLERIHPDDRRTVVTSFKRALAVISDGEIDLDYRFLDSTNHQYRWITNRGRRIQDNNGKVRILGTTREITAERQAAEELKRINTLLEMQIEERHQAEQRQAAYVRMSDMLRGQFDPEAVDRVLPRLLGETLHSSRALLIEVEAPGERGKLLQSWPYKLPCGIQVFNFTDYGDLAYDLHQGEMIVIEDVRHDVRTAEQADNFAQAGVCSLMGIPRQEQGHLCKVLILLQDEPRRWLDEEISFARDISERAWSAQNRMQAERALRKSEEQFRTLADNMSQLAWMANPAGVIYWYNKRWYDYTGATLEAMQALGIGSMHHPEHRERVIASMQRAFSIGLVWEDTYPLRGKDGRYNWFLSRALPIRDELGRVIHWFGTYTDVTAQVAAEEALRELNNNLERRVVERTHELAESNSRLQIEMNERERAEEALRHAQKMEAIGQLTGGLAHDFNNMLTGVVGSLDMIQRRLGRQHSTEVDRYIDAAVTSANRAAALTHRLLAFARRQSLDPQPVDVNRLILSMEDMLRRTIGEHIQLTTQLKPTLWLAHTDAHQLENALLNLVINSRDAMPAGGRLLIGTANIAIDHSLPDSTEPGDYVQLSVSDTGCGMSTEVITKAFDPFFTTKPIGQGTGLGLSMVYGFVKQTGGQVHIDSQPGQGTSISLLLPRDQQEPIQAEAAVDTREVPCARNDETILVVEDEAAVRMLVIEVLQELGYAVLEASGSDSALPILSSERKIDLLITDVGLPGMNGRQLADIARNHRPDLKILFVTGYAANARVRGEFLSLGMEMLAKPFNIDALAMKVRQMIES